ncbi:hypothetical protein SKAU_G00276480 [Synaphobranchus kaupii]|uniref:Uncharacterized protein n=1 Tax=Synaphobranchus kaupii TaxID=118154 RepID=A0A9Q1F183_SYNKA|nr:hypothetical protein SKAU_G00276480 [Synaphobranchus kaupii]
MSGTDYSKPELDLGLRNGFQAGTGLDRWCEIHTWTGLELDREVHSGNGFWNGTCSKPELDFKRKVNFTPGLDWNWTGRSTLEAGTGTELVPSRNWTLRKGELRPGTGLELDQEIHSGNRRVSGSGPSPQGVAHSVRPSFFFSDSGISGRWKYTYTES